MFAAIAIKLMPYTGTKLDSEYLAVLQMLVIKR